MAMDAVSEMMNAVRFHAHGGPEVLRYEEVARPVPGPGEVLARVEVIGINFADVVRRRGGTYPVPSPLPFTLGGEAVGTIVAIGPGGDPALIGTRSFIFPGSGCYADYAVVAEDRIYPLPASLDAQSSVALFVQGLSAALILRDAARLKQGETVLIQGAAGGVGTFAVQLAKLWGAGMVIGAAGSQAKRDAVLQLGSDAVVDYGAVDWVDQVRAMTGGRGVDIVLEMTGGRIARESLSLLAPFGRSVVFGSASEEPWSVDPGELPPRNLSIIGFWLRQYLDDRDLLLGLLDEFAMLIGSGRLQVKIDSNLPLSKAARAHELLERRETSGKLVMTPDCQDASHA